MSECVVRIEMPKSCRSCPLCSFVGFSPVCARRLFPLDTVSQYYYADKKPSNCPILYQLPEEHGRLRNELPTVSPWHRVEEPPKPYETVIAYVDPWHIFAAYHNGHGAWKENDGFNVIGVRYWMPIDPPMETQD